MGMLANRLARVYRHLRKWARRTDVTCFRLYEKDIPDQPLIVDWYDGRALVWAFRRKKDETPEAREAWLDEVEAEVRAGLCLEPGGLYFKERSQRKGGRQYERLDDARHEIVVREQGLQFHVNLSDYLDTGLFLDHRNLRRRVREEAAGRRVLNLFAYTGSFSVYAAAGAARSVTTVDISNTYLAWARRNFALNGLPAGELEFLRADVLRWLPQAAAEGRRFDLIVCDPPTFSNSKKMDGYFDVQAGHPGLIRDCIALLSPGGTLYFSTNDRGFSLETDAWDLPEPVEISDETVPVDFRNRRIHRCWHFSA